jgi:hypothetical protein
MHEAHTGKQFSKTRTWMYDEHWKGMTFTGSRKDVNFVLDPHATLARAERKVSVCSGRPTEMRMKFFSSSFS